MHRSSVYKEKYDKKTLLMEACTAECAQTLLVDNKTKVNFSNERSSTLTCACYSRSVEMIQVLIDNGVAISD